jgi:hypothetical protein
MYMSLRVLIFHIITSQDLLLLCIITLKSFIFKLLCHVIDISLSRRIPIVHVQKDINYLIISSEAVGLCATD